MEAIVYYLQFTLESYIIREPRTSLSKEWKGLVETFDPFVLRNV